MLEHDIQNEIRIWCGEHNILAIRINVGLFFTSDGRPIKSGPPKGFPDLMLLTPEGEIIFCECKTNKGRLRPEQIQFQAELKKRNFKTIVPYGFDDFLKKIGEVYDYRRH